jgi:hypothetical protein
MKTLRKPKKLAPLCVLLSSWTLSACATSPAVIDKGCDWTRQITYSKRDTPDTATQIRQHNAARDALCERKNPRQPQV